ncbi:MAG: M23 family metallopeptidase [Methylophilus sp.]|uniref:M23 family metallopeptidase n=1 Tax=Methylophilus sp. TaxID=29541 RepID=UPI003FA17DBD
MKKIIYVFISWILLSPFIPEQVIIPVLHASAKDWNRDSYWFAPWGKSGVHKGIDIFANKGRPVHSASKGLVLYAGALARGGHVVAIISPKCRIHYYAHLDTIQVSPFAIVTQHSAVGTVGNSGNAIGKPPHLHYSIFRFLPDLADITLETQGWKRMFYVNPHVLLTNT